MNPCKPAQPCQTVDQTYLVEKLAALLNIPSPTGYTEQAIDYTRELLGKFSGLTISVNRKGALLATWPGQHSDTPRALTAHVDTLGAVVKEIKPTGRLRLSQIGGYAWNTVEGEGCYDLHPRRKHRARLAAAGQFLGACQPPGE